jgi:hypothetical protein
MPHEVHVPVPAPIRDGLHWVSRHTGLPVLLVAAIALVLSFRIFRQTLRLAIEVALALVLIFGATAMGWISW